MHVSCGNIFLSYVNELYICLEIYLFSRFMSIVPWPGMSHLVPTISQNACVGEQPGATLSVLKHLFSLMSSLLKAI